MRAYLWMLLAAASFSLMGGFAHAAGKRCDWQTIAFGRALIPLGLMTIWSIAEGAPLIVLRPWSLWVRSIAGSTALVLTFFCFTRLPVGDVLTLTNLFPVWLALLSWPVLGEVPSLSTWIAIAVGMTGVALIQQPHFASGNWATLAAVASSFCSAAAMLGLHRLGHIPPRAILLHFSAVSLLFCVIAWTVSPTARWNPGFDRGATIALLVGVGLSATVGQYGLTKAFTTGVPSQVAVVGLSQVAFGMLLDVVWFGRVFTAPTLLGTACVLAPTAWLMTHGRKPLAD